MIKPKQTNRTSIAANYSFKEEYGVWLRGKPENFAYSDGDEVEQRILDAILGSADRSLFSPSIAANQVDWPSIYHLSPTRANLLRPLEGLLTGARVLEIGAGCGAITRYLGEAGADVIALEGSLRRATIASARCQDLGNVRVVCDRFDMLDVEGKFDVITLIGVLEYSRIYASGDDPIQATLDLARQLLTDDGVLVVAIENQLGLKYFAGVNEDHLGRPMAGIEDHYREDGVVTFGKAELEERLRLAGYFRSEFALPFPDYKLPVSLVLPAGLTDPTFVAADLAGQAVRADRQLQSPTLFSMRQTFGVLERNGLLDDLANSFLAVAGKSEGSPQFASFAANVLAAHYSSDRLPQFAKAATFVRSGDEIRVVRSWLCDENQSRATPLIEQQLKDETYTPGRHWGQELEAIVSRAGWTLDEIGDWADVWIEALRDAVGLHDSSISDLDTTVAGKWLDAMPRNLTLGETGPKFFDLEWISHPSLSWGFLLYRGLADSLTSATRIAAPAQADLAHVPTLIRAVLRRRGILITQTQVEMYYDAEALVQDESNGLVRRAPPKATMDEFWLPISPEVGSILRYGGAQAQDASRLSAELHSLREAHDAALRQIDADVGHAHQLEVRVGDLEAQLAEKQAQADELVFRAGAVSEELHSLREAHDAALRQIDADVAHAHQLEVRVGELEAQVAEKQAQADGLLLRVGALSEELAQLKAVHERDVQASLAAAEQLHRQIAQGVEDHDHVAGKLALVESAHAAASEELESLLQAIEKLRSESAQARSDLHEFRSAADAEHDLLLTTNLELRREIADKEREIHRLWELLDAAKLREGDIAALRQQANAVLDAMGLRRSDATSGAHLTSELIAHIKRVQGSRSWKVTRSFRSAGRRLRSVARHAKNLAYRSVESIYRALPGPTARRIKHVTFSATGRLLSRTGAYRRWKAERGLRAGPVQDMDAAVYEIQRIDAPANMLWMADGHREWADYSEIKSRIDTALSMRPAMDPAHLELLRVEASEVENAARAIRFPAASAAPDVSILVPVYNHLSTTLECLTSLANCTTDESPSFEVIVADDASTDKTSQVLSLVANLKVVRQIANQGFLLNCNSAAQQARGRYLLLLNNDVQVTPGWLKALVDTYEANPDTGAVGPKIVYPSGWLQEAGTRLRRDGTSEMLGLNDDPSRPRYSYRREVDYCSGACLLLKLDDFLAMGGFDTQYAPAYCEDSDLCMRLRSDGKHIVYCPESIVVHHLSRTSDSLDNDYKLSCIAANVEKFTQRWRPELEALDDVRTIAFYLPQFHPFPENDLWWGKGFTEWTNVTKAKPNFVGHYQPRVPADLGYYDLRLSEVMEQQAELARRYGVGGFCYYYYWFAGKRLLERPLEQMLETGRPDFPFCLCWANENWTRRWDGNEQDVLMAQCHSDEDDEAVIHDLMRFFRSGNYIRINGKPLILVYRVTLFPDFARTATLWRDACRKAGIGEIYIVQVESFELATAGIRPDDMGCDAATEFPPQGMADPYPVTAQILNDQFEGAVADYRELAIKYATREFPGYKRFMGTMPGWDNTARRQNNSYCFENATPGAFQAWLETAVVRTKQQYSGDERLIFINAWNEWAEGAYLEPDRRFGHAFLQAHLNAKDAGHLVRHGSYSLG